MGRRPTPAGVLKARGTYRADRHGGGIPCPAADQVGDPPAWLSEGAQDFWREMAPQLKALGLLDNLSVGPFTLMAVTWDGWVQTTLRLRETGETYTKGEGEGALEKRHPLVAICASYRDAFLKIAGEFGMSPAARMKLRGLPPPEEPESEEEEALFSGRALDNSPL
jgi:P27 family predicted phage terminase small subunit